MGSRETGVSVDIPSLASLLRASAGPVSPSASSHMISNLLCRLVIISSYKQEKAINIAEGMSIVKIKNNNQ